MYRVTVATHHPEPTDATVKQLYGSAYFCAFPGCLEPLYRSDAAARVRVLNSRVSHIAARSEGGPRWDPAMSPEKNRSDGNLLLLCLKHAAEVDDEARVSQFPSDLLREWKAVQLATYEGMGRGFALSDDETAEAAELSFREGTIDLSRSEIHLGGTGGSAPGAGGGGGGAIGPGAVGGEGGGGGDVIHGWFRAADLPDVVDIRVGRGGRGADPGGAGEDGEDSSFGGLVARGGRGGRPGRPRATGRVDELVQVPVAMVADGVSIRDGVLFILGGAWSHTTFDSLPGRVVTQLVVVVDAQGSTGSTTLEFQAASPMGRTSTIGTASAPAPDGVAPIARSFVVVPLDMAVDEPGVWTVRVLRGGQVLAEVSFEVRVGGEGTRTVDA